MLPLRLRISSVPATMNYFIIHFQVNRSIRKLKWQYVGKFTTRRMCSLCWPGHAGADRRVAYLKIILYQHCLVQLACSSSVTCSFFILEFAIYLMLLLCVTRIETNQTEKEISVTARRGSDTWQVHSASCPVSLYVKLIAIWSNTRTESGQPLVC
jgi:hypothetical protein